MGQSWSEEEALQFQIYEEPNHTNTKSSFQNNTENATNPKTTMEVKLPHRWDSIIREAVTPPDTSSSDKLLQQLCNGIFLAKNKKKYWVEKKSNTNCFFLYARDLSIKWSEDNRYWKWLKLDEASNESVEGAEVLDVCWLEIHGKFDTGKLSPKVTYEVAFVLKLKDPSYGWEYPVNFSLTLPNGKKQLRKENLQTKPRGQWIEISAGEFVTSPEIDGEIDISMYEYESGKWKKGLILKGITIQPKNRS